MFAFLRLGIGVDPGEDGKVLVTPLEPAAVYISKLEHRTGEKNGNKWTQYFVTLSDGRTGSFFDGQLGVSAQAAFASKAPVVATFEQKGKFTNLVSLLRAD